METGNQPESRGRSRGKWNREKKKEEKNTRSLKQQEAGRMEQEHQDSQTQSDQEPGDLEQKNACRKIAAAVGGAVLAAAVAAGAVYAGMGQKYKRAYFPNTTINGLDVSGLTPEEAKTKMTGETSGYTLTIQERGGESEVIHGSDIGLHPEFDGTLEQILENQSPLTWGFHIGRYVDYTIDTMAAFDDAKLSNAVSGLECLKPERTEAPQDAYISDYISGKGYEIVPEKQGTSPEVQLLSDAVQDAILNFQDTLSLEDADVYEKPQITADNEALNAELSAWNKYVNTTVTYRFGSQSEVLDGEKIHTWLVSDGQGGVSLDEAQVADYVSWLAKNYNTAYKPKTLKTSYGQTVTVDKSVYGWKINQAEETAALKQILLSGESQEREPVYSQTAASHDGNDYGNTYAEINLTAQHMFFYKEGKLVVESDFVSGNESRGWSTPAGVYPLTYKQRNATLKGENYATPVSYWMPFNGGIGMHDAYWRSSFGGKIYKTNGSHGCINLPPAVAKTIYENISAGMPVICYHLDGSASGKTSTTAQNGGTASETKPQQTQPAQTAAETKAQQNAESGQGSTETAASQPDGASQSSAAQPTTAEAQTETPVQPTTTAVQPTTAATSGAAQPSPGQNSSGQNVSSGNLSSGGPDSGSAEGSGTGSLTGVVQSPGTGN